MTGCITSLVNIWFFARLADLTTFGNVVCAAAMVAESTTPMGNTPEPGVHVNSFHMSASQSQIHRDGACDVPFVPTELLIN